MSDDESTSSVESEVEKKEIDQFLSYPLRNLENAASFAIDIGGSLTKLAYYSTVKDKQSQKRRKGIV